LLDSQDLPLNSPNNEGVGENEIPDQEMHENLHRARTLLSSRMDDVRALKRMISETKDTLEFKRRQRLLQEIREQAAAKAAGEAQVIYSIQE
jgi:hypothetical protein